MIEEFDIEKEFEDYQEYLKISNMRLKLVVNFDLEDENSELDKLLNELNNKEIVF